MNWRLKTAMRAPGALLAFALRRTWVRCTGREPGAFFEANGTRLHYRIEGAGEPLVLVHGFATRADINWRLPGTTKALARRYQVISLDQRGHWPSDMPTEPEHYGLEMVEDIVRLLDHLGIEKAHVVGYSMGGFITLKLVTLHPERLSSAAPCGAGWGVTDEKSLALLDGVAQSLIDGKGFGPLITHLDPREGKPGPLVIALINWFFRLVNEERPLGCLMKRFPDFEVSEEALRANTVPVLSIAGSRDPLCADVRRMIGVMANHEAVIIEGADHLTTMLHPQFINAIVAFLEKHQGGVTTGEAAQETQ